MSQVEFRMTVSNYRSKYLVSFVPQTIPFPKANAVAKVNSHSDATCAPIFVCYFCCTVLLVSLSEIYLTEGKLVLGVSIRTKCITPQNCLLPSSQEPKLMRCRRLHLCYLKTRAVVSTWVLFKGLCFTSSTNSEDGDGIRSWCG